LDLNTVQQMLLGIVIYNFDPGLQPNQDRALLVVVRHVPTKHFQSLGSKQTTLGPIVSVTPQPAPVPQSLLIHLSVMAFAKVVSVALLAPLVQLGFIVKSL